MKEIISSDYSHEEDIWKDNHDFMFFKVPPRYQKYYRDEVLNMHSIAYDNDFGEIARLESRINVNLLEIGELKDKNWEEKEGWLVYLDKISERKLSIKRKTLEELNNSKITKLDVEILIDKDYYIEYRVLGTSSDIRKNLGMI